MLDANFICYNVVVLSIENGHILILKYILLKINVKKMFVRSI